MNLRLASSNDDRALAIRDHVLPLVRERGSLLVQRNDLRLTELTVGPWVFRHWTPFNTLGPEEALSPGYRHAIERQRSRRNLPYGLEISREETVLDVSWADDGATEVRTFVRGSWEAEALAMR